MNVTVIGLIAATCTTVSFVPQALRILKTKHTKDLSLPMYIIMNIGIILWFTYGILLSDLPMIFANSITLIFTLVILVMKLRYK